MNTLNNLLTAIENSYKQEDELYNRLNLALNKLNNQLQ